MGEASSDPTVAALKSLHEPQKELFDKIDGLRGLGVGRIVSLPQIIVVGDQSSGKSSVLEAISRVRFPVDGGLCTRFATELVLRNSKKTAIAVSIDWDTEPADAVKKEADEKLGSFDTKEKLKEIVGVAKQLMGIRKGKGFSKDVLRIKVSDPDVPDLSLVDLPGFYHAENETQTATDRAVVNDLVLRYMRQKNSIILAVVSAKVDPVMQQVLSEARKPDIDPKLERTIGVVTQPDRLESGTSTEETYLTLVGNRNKSLYLKHEWHVLRNRSESEKDWSDDKRDASEADFLSSGPWASFPRENMGVESLRLKLGGVLFRHIADNLPAVVETMEQAVIARQRKLDQLGKRRSTAEEMRVYLTNIGQRFENLARSAILGNYLDDFFTESEVGPVGRGKPSMSVRKLRARVRDMNRAFVISMYTKGNKQSIKWEDGAPDTMGSTDPVPGRLQSLLEKHYHFNDPEVVTERDFVAEAEEVASTTQGLEFPGEPSAIVTLKLFQRRSAPWQGISTRHLDLVTEVAKQFVKELLSYIIVSDPETRDRIVRGFVDPFFQGRKTTLHSKLNEILPTTDDVGFLLPLEHEFEIRSQYRKQARLDKILGNNIAQFDADVAEIQKEIILGHENFAKAWVEKNKDQAKSSHFGVEDVIDNMIAYYEVSLTSKPNVETVLLLTFCTGISEDLHGKCRSTGRREAVDATHTQDIQSRNSCSND